MVEDTSDQDYCAWKDCLEETCAALVYLILAKATIPSYPKTVITVCKRKGGGKDNNGAKSVVLLTVIYILFP